MGLKEEQILRNCRLAERRPRIYSTGVYLVPLKIQICGIDQFVWVADDFNDDSFDDQGNLVSPYIISDEHERMYERG